MTISIFCWSPVDFKRPTEILKSMNVGQKFRILCVDTENFFHLPEEELCMTQLPVIQFSLRLNQPFLIPLANFSQIK